MLRDPADRRFASWLALVAGPLFVVGGFLAAFTEPGAWFIAIGLGFLVGGILLRTRVPASIAVGVATAVAVALVLWFEAEGRGP